MLSSSVRLNAFVAGSSWRSKCHLTTDGIERAAVVEGDARAQLEHDRRRVGRARPTRPGPARLSCSRRGRRADRRWRAGRRSRWCWWRCAGPGWSARRRARPEVDHPSSPPRRRRGWGLPGRPASAASVGFAAAAGLAGAVAAAGCWRPRRASPPEPRSAWRRPAWPAGWWARWARPAGRRPAAGGSTEPPGGGRPQQEVASTQVSVTHGESSDK